MPLEDDFTFRGSTPNRFITFEDRLDLGDGEAGQSRESLIGRVGSAPPTVKVTEVGAEPEMIPRITRTEGA